jgi:hypothetical protein
MSSIYRFRVTGIEKGHLRIKATIVHPDENRIYTTPNFALQIILDPFYALSRGYTYDMPFNETEAKTIVDAAPLKAAMTGWLVLQHGKEVEITEQEYTNMDEVRSSGDPKFSGVRSWGMSNGIYSVSYKPEYSKFMEVAEEQIVSVELQNPKHYPRIIDEMSYEERAMLSDEETEAHYANEPEAELVIQVKNPDILFHLRKRMEWESAIYDFAHYA